MISKYILPLAAIVFIPSCLTLKDSGLKHKIAEDVKVSEIYKYSAYETEKGKPTVALVLTNDCRHFPMLFNIEGGELVPLKQTVYSEHKSRGSGEAIKYTIVPSDSHNNDLPLDRYHVSVAWSRKLFKFHRLISYSTPVDVKTRKGWSLREFNPKLKEDTSQ